MAHYDGNTTRRLFLRNLLEDSEEAVNEESGNLDKLKKINSILLKTDKLLNEGDITDRIQHTGEVVLDVQIMKMNHELLGGVIENVIQTEFTEDDLSNAILKNIYKNDNEDWNEITKLAIDISYTTKFSSSLLGSIDDNVEIQAKEIKLSQRKRKNDKIKESQPEILKEIKKENEGAQRCNYVLRIIRKLSIENNYGPISFYKLIIDPYDFINTIDNAFQIAFLAKDGRIRTQIGGDGLPEIILLSKDQSNQLTNNSTDTTQAICSFNLNFINEMIKKYKISEALLPLNDQLNSSQPGPSGSNRN